MSAKHIPEKMARQFRAITIDRAQPEGDSAENRFSFALSSEEPADQWFGREVLSHKDSAVRQDRLKAGIPLLFNHDRDQHMGVVDGYSIKSGKLRVEGRWSSSDFAQQKKRDYDEGILKDASVGYMIHKIQRDQVGENPSSDDTLNVIDWEPMEASLVTIPADPTVGVGRAAGEIEVPVAVEVVRRSVPDVEPAAPAAIPVVIEVRTTMAEQTQVPDANQVEIARRDRIMALASDKEFSRFVTTADAREAIEKSMSADAFAESISRKMVAANDASKVGTAGENVMRDAGKDARKYSLARAHRFAINQAKQGTFASEDTSFEREVSEEISKRLGVKTMGLLIPNSVSRTVSAGSGSGLTAQTALISTVTQPDVIEMYRNRPRVLALGATRLGGLSGIIRLPRQTGAGTFAWLAENANTTASDVTTDYVSITPRRGSIQNKYTIELLAESSADVENLLANDRNRVTSLAIDFASLAGPSGGASPVGILNTSGLATISASGATLANGKALSYADWLKFESTVAAANADSATSGFLLTPEVRAQAKGTPMFASGYAMPIWSSNQRDPDGLEVGPLGYKAGVTNQMPKNFGSGTNLHGVVFGDFSQVIVADYGASELIVDPYTAAGQGVFVVTERVLMDVAVRHISAFVACEDVAVV